MHIYLTKETAIDGVSHPIGRRIDTIAGPGTCRSLIRVGRAVVRRDGPPAATPEPATVDDADDSDAETEQDDDDAIDVEFESLGHVDDSDDRGAPAEAAGDELGGVPMDDLDDGSSDAETDDPAGESPSVRTLGLAPSLVERLEDHGLRTVAEARKFAADNGGRFSEGQIPRVGDVNAERINTALGL